MWPHTGTNNPDWQPDKRVTAFGGFLNLGQSFTSSGKIVRVKVFYTPDNETKHTILMNIINNLYDLTQKGLTAQLNLQYMLSLLTTEEKQIATDKG